MHIHGVLPQKEKVPAILAIAVTLLLILACLVYLNAMKPAAKRPAVTSPPELPHLSFFMDGSELEKLEAERKNAAALPIFESKDAWYKGYIRDQGEVYPVSLRLKGDWTTHLKNAHKWSFRVKTLSDHPVLGLHVFSLHHPRERRYLSEWLYHRALQSEGLIGLYYSFVGVSLNGEDLGIYAFEQHFDKLTIERAQRREGPILKLNETRLWKKRLSFFNHNQRSVMEDSDSYLNTTAELFNEKQLRNNEQLSAQADIALLKLKAFQQGKGAPGEVMALKEWARFLALVDLFGASHGTYWINLRFYFNPVTALLEPVGFDGNAGDLTRSLQGEGRYLAMDPTEEPSPTFHDTLFSDRLMMETYLKELYRLSDPAWLDGFFAKHEQEYAALDGLLGKEFGEQHNPRINIRKNAHLIRQLIVPNLPELRAALTAPSATSTLTLSLENLSNLPILVDGLSYKGDLVFRPDHEVLLQARGAMPQANLAAFRATAKTTYPSDELKVVYHVLGTPLEVKQTVLLGKPNPDQDLLKLAPPKLLDTSLPFIDVEPSARVIRLKAGSFSIDKDLVFPVGYRVEAGPGVHLILDQGASIYSWSPLDFRGSEEDPILIEARDRGRGLVVFDTDQPSTLSHVVFKGLKEPRQLTWNLPGAVTFYQADVSISHCAFLNLVSEDGLNVVRSRLHMEHCQFEGNSSDSLDVDFGTGEVYDVSFQDIGNDGMDFSGSQFTLRDIRMSRIGDKGVSSGEGSQIILEQAEIENAYIGLASKDTSRFQVDQVFISQCKVGLAVYCKKPEFGASRMIAKGQRVVKCETPYMLDVGSQLVLMGGKPIAETSQVFKKLYPDEGQKQP